MKTIIYIKEAEELMTKALDELEPRLSSVGVKREAVELIIPGVLFDLETCLCPILKQDAAKHGLHVEFTHVAEGTKVRVTELK